MKAGRDLDALIAEKVTNLPNIHIVTGNHHHANGLVYGKHLLTGYPESVPFYSTDIAAAWKVVEKIPMTVHAPGASYAHGEYANSDDAWLAEARMPGIEYYNTVTSKGQTSPEAICLAALKTLGIDYDEEE